MNIYEIVWDRKYKQFLITGPYTKKWCKDREGAYGYATMLARKNAPATVRWYKSGGSVSSWTVNPNKIKRFTR